MKELSKRIQGYTDYCEGYYGLDIHRYDSRHENFTAQTLGLQRNRFSVLDVGCGDGFWSNMLSKYYRKVTGIDPSLCGIETARARYPDLEFELIDFFEYNTPHDAIFIRGMSLQNAPMQSEKMKKAVDRLFELAGKEVIYIERSTWPKLDPEYWHYKNPTEVYAYLGKYGKVTLAKHIRNTIFVRVTK